MLTIRDLIGNEEALTDFKELTLNRKVNGEKLLSMTLIPTKHNEHSFPMVEEESILIFEDEEYVIKKVSERSIGNTFLKRVEAIHKFYVDMINKQQPLIHNGSKTFADYLSFVFSGTGYTYSIIDTFYAQDFENLGNDNRLALLQKGLERYKAEMEIVGTNIRFRNKVGNDTDFQFRYGHNIKSIEKNVDTTNLATVIRGTGAEGISAYYRSPNADLFGEIDAPPVEDERFTSQSALLEEMKSRLEDTPEFSITIDFVDLRAAGYPWTVPNEGDRVFIIYEPMNDLLIETRILEITEVYDANFNIVKTNVTLANYKKTFAGTMFNNINKRLSDLVNSDGVIKYNVLDEAVKIATQAIKSAQTELEFNNGIIARDPNNPNNLVLFTSAGIGVSTDGGNTFREALTYQGLVASVGVVGQFAANNIQIGPATTFEEGYNPNKIISATNNLIKNSGRFSSLQGWSLNGGTSLEVVEDNGMNVIRAKGSITGEHVYNIKPNTEYIFSAEVYFNKDINIYSSNPLHYWFGTTGDLGGAIEKAEVISEVNPIPAYRWHTIAIRIKTKSILQPNTFFKPFIYDEEQIPPTEGYWVRSFMFAEGNKLATWSPNPEDIKTDLRMTAPLPTSLTMNQDGIKATTLTDPNKYAQLDYRGLFVKRGAIQIERPDGYNLILDGQANFDLAVQSGSPPYVDDEKYGDGTFVVTMQGPYARVASTAYRRFDYLGFKHTSRYLSVSLYGRSGGGGAYTYVQVRDENGNALATNMTNATGDTSIGLNIDLGTPTGLYRHFYIYFRTTDISYPALVRMATKYLNG
jgi:phage minor structural protein